MKREVQGKEQCSNEKRKLGKQKKKLVREINRKENV